MFILKPPLLGLQPPKDIPTSQTAAIAVAENLLRINPKRVDVLRRRSSHVLVLTKGGYEPEARRQGENGMGNGRRSRGALSFWHPLENLVNSAPKMKNPGRFPVGVLC